MQAKDLNIIQPERKSVIDKTKEFIRELEITKHRLETKPRKVNIMDSQQGMFADIMDVTPRKRLYIPGKEGFV